eukprot:CAMPEP_0171157036 /NCGR_PEP_ID=MMETSP0790-20130122/1753_1 /TAXON_ID=2925 /ORGANISM="Alexandrium catenella, Strain OF101" /LENGTH=57 /DNA_ID=CAMNT_0011621363 /DNA_START=429 /DNA_END=599 /DNA_ORIENTATION=+
MLIGVREVELGGALVKLVREHGLDGHPCHPCVAGLKSLTATQVFGQQVAGGSVDRLL